MTKKVKSYLIYIPLFFVLMVFLGPYLWMFLTSVKSQAQIFAWPPKILPTEYHWENFVKIWQDTTLPRALFNTVFVSTSATLINVVFSSLAAFAFARLRFPFRNTLFLLVLATMMVPPGLMVVPLFSLLKNMPFAGPEGWLDSYSGLIFPVSVTGFAIFLFRQYFLTIPKDLDDQAAIDGCSKLRIYWSIILPLSKPAIGLVFIFSFLQHWNEYLWPLTVARSEEMYTLQIALASFQTQYNINWAMLMAGATTAALPMILLYFILQPIFEQGLGGIGRGVKD